MFGISRTEIKKKILVNLLWGLGFPLIGLMVWMIVFCGIGLLGVFPGARGPVGHLYAFFVWVYYLSMCASPLLGLALAIWGLLPGTRKHQSRTTA
jgi:hypothetical protein